MAKPCPRCGDTGEAHLIPPDELGSGVQIFRGDTLKEAQQSAMNCNLYRIGTEIARVNSNLETLHAALVTALGRE